MHRNSFHFFMKLGFCKKKDNKEKNYRNSWHEHKSYRVFLKYLFKPIARFKKGTNILKRGKKGSLLFFLSNNKKNSLPLGLNTIYDCLYFAHKQEIDARSCRECIYQT